MKTKINFNIDSKEITKQLGDVLTAEVKSNIRKTAEKAMQDILNEKFKSLINGLDYISNNTWSEGNRFSQYIKEAIKEVVRDAFKNHSNILDEEIKRHARQCVEEYRLDIAKITSMIPDMVSKEITKQVSEVIKNKVIENLFKNN